MSKLSLSDASALLLRNLEYFQNQKCLLVNGAGDQLPTELAAANSSVVTINTNYEYFLNYQTQPNVQAHFLPAPLTDNFFDSIILYWPKEKPLAQMQISQLLPQLNEDGKLFIVGANSQGIKSAATLLKKMALNCQKLDSAKHCVLFATSTNNTQKTSNLQQHLEKIQLNVAGQSLVIAGFPSVFNSGRLDEGTQLLLENLPEQLGKSILDFGCGCGVISAFIKQKQPQTKIIAVDINACALFASKQTFALNQLEVATQPVTGIKDLTGRKFDAIVTNPPFHQGTATDYSITEQLIAQSFSLLNNSGKLILVANSFLKYQTLLEQAFEKVEILQSTNKFTVYQCFKN